MTAAPGTTPRVITVRDAEAEEARRRTVLLAPLLRTLRSARGLSPGDVAGILGCNKSKVSRMENGARIVQPGDVRLLLDAYGFRGPEAGALLSAARSGLRDWWAACPQLMTGDFALYAVLELAAARILACQPYGVPDLLRAPGYAKACARRDPAIPADGEDACAAALGARQETVLRGPFPPALRAVCAARIPPGTADGRDMAEQAGYLAAPPPAIKVSFLPAADACLSGTGPFTILQFDTGPLPAVAYQPGPAGGTLITGVAETRAYLTLFWTLEQAARPPVPREGSPA